MRFMIIRKADPQTEAGVMPSAALVDAMQSYNEEMVRAGVMADCQMPTLASGCVKVSIFSTGLVRMKKSASTTHSTAPITMPTAW